MVTGEIYLYNLRNAKGEAIIALCKVLEINCTHVEPTQYSLSLGVLTGVQISKDSFQLQAAHSIPHEALLFKGFTPEMIQAFLQAYNAKGISRVQLKATLTTHNLSWNSYELIHELYREFQAFQKSEGATQ
jgi:hypothetical protein